MKAGNPLRAGYVERASLHIAKPLVRFVEEQALLGLDIPASRFWSGVVNIFAAFTEQNRRLIRERELLQQEIDSRYARAGKANMGDQIGFLRDIGYLMPEPGPFCIDPRKVDAEVAEVAGPQLVVPALNARFLLNAVNARWGSLYDALYGTDALGSLPAAKGYDAARGAQVIRWAREFLDDAVPLTTGSWHDLTRGQEPALQVPDQYVGRTSQSRLYRHNGLHIDVMYDPASPIGSSDKAGISDVVLEAALTTIVDLEDSVAAVDAEDKVAAYANWFGVIQGQLEATFEKNGCKRVRRLAPDRNYKRPDGSQFTLSGRSLLFVRNVGHHMETPAVRLPDGSNAPEGILDGIITALIGMHDLKRHGRFVNSRAGSIYIVKPKMHGPKETAFTNALFNAIEDLLSLARHTIKIGIMDEERRTSANLAACIREVSHRVVFINTGFLDRTGDEIHTAMHAGPMVRKVDMKGSEWIRAYEDRNVQIGLAAGFAGRAQIGKGMWAAPDRMAEMLEQKIVHPRSGASTAWVPSPTAAVLHATHYHRVDVAARQVERSHEAVTPLAQLLSVPVAGDRNWSQEEICAELANNAQSVLGYVVRWIDQGVGCSKVPDIDDIGLMEDRATLRISSQHIANWLLHGVVNRNEVEHALLRMAARVDKQNEGDTDYHPMTDRTSANLAYQAARALVFEGIDQPCGYTEPILHRYRAMAKSRLLEGAFLATSLR